MALMATCGETLGAIQILTEAEEVRGPGSFSRVTWNVNSPGDKTRVSSCRVGELTKSAGFSGPRHAAPLSVKQCLFVAWQNFKRRGRKS